MKKYLIATAMVALLSTSAYAAKIGVSMDKFDDNFLTVLRNGMSDYAKTVPGVTLQIEDAKDDVSKQLSQIQNFIANKVDAIIVNPVDTSATAAMTKLAADAGVPLVYVNREPADVDEARTEGGLRRLERKATPGTLETKQICKLLGGKGDILVMEGELSNQAAVQRTKDIHEVIATPECSGIKIIAEQTAVWDRTKAQNLMTNWLSKGMKYDALVSNNDEMAIGAIQALKAAGVDTKKAIVGGVDATQDALASMKAGDLKVTVFQDAAGQGKGAVDAALKLAAGEKVDKKVYIPVPARDAGQYGRLHEEELRSGAVRRAGPLRRCFAAGRTNCFAPPQSRNMIVAKPPFPSAGVCSLRNRASHAQPFDSASCPRERRRSRRRIFARGGERP